MTGAGGGREAISLYVHFPFCLHKCAYCDFVSYPYSAEAAEAYVRTLCGEIERQGARFGPLPARTVYLGGGTPSLLADGQLRRILDRIRSSFPEEAACEISIEANPGTFDEKAAEAWLRAGINRVSLGVQSFRDERLRALERIHGGERAVGAVRALRSAGFSNISLDLIYGLPGQSAADWRESLGAALELGVPHLSCYSLIVEDATKLKTRLENKEAPALPCEEEVLEMEETALGMTRAAGLERYEVSNYARPGMECRHNLTYWQCLPYLGFGCAAHSMMDGRRFFNTPSLLDYGTGDPRCRGIRETEGSRTERMFERAMMGLRMCRGVDIPRFEADFGAGPERIWPESVRTMKERGLAVLAGRSWRLTDEGMRVMNALLVMLLEEQERGSAE